MTTNDPVCEVTRDEDSSIAQDVRKLWSATKLESGPKATSKTSATETGEPSEPLRPEISTRKLRSVIESKAGPEDNPDATKTSEPIKPLLAAKNTESLPKDAKNAKCFSQSRRSF